MKAISLHQPFASAIALGAKKIETRGWYTDYRGPLAIHAAKRCVRTELNYYAEELLWRGALNLKPQKGNRLWDILPFGSIIAVAYLTQCDNVFKIKDSVLYQTHRRPWDDKKIYTWLEYELGDFSLGRFGWILEDVKARQKPIPFRGAQGLFGVPVSLLVDITKTGEKIPC